MVMCHRFTWLCCKGCCSYVVLVAMVIGYVDEWEFDKSSYMTDVHFRKLHLNILNRHIKIYIRMNEYQNMRQGWQEKIKCILLVHILE